LALKRFADTPGDDLGQLVPVYLSPCTGLGNTHGIDPNPLKY
jgi:hypothetical protein